MELLASTSDPMQLSGTSSSRRVNAQALVLKRSYASLSDTEKTVPLEEFAARVKRQRLAIYEGMTDREPEAKAGLILQLGAWLCQHHGFGLTHPITQRVQHVSCPSVALPFDMICDDTVGDKGYGCPDILTPLKKSGLCDTPEESLILSTAIGRQQIATYIGLVRAASMLVTVMDKTASLQCRFCEKRCTDGNVHLMTVAEEYTPTCKHPKIANDEVVWASDDRFSQHDLYGSRSVPGKEHEREGSAVCLDCLYEHVIRHDTFLAEDISTWYAFEIAAMKNLLTPSEPAVRRLCSCSHPTIQGAMCLFRFSLVVRADTGGGVYAMTTAVNIPLMITQMLRNDAAGSSGSGSTVVGEPIYHFDEVDPVMEKMVLDSTRFSTRFSEPHGILEPPTASTLQSLINRRFDQADVRMHRLEYSMTMLMPNTNNGTQPQPQSLPQPQQQQPAVFAWHTPTAEEQAAMTLDDHYRFMESALPMVEAYYRSANQLASSHSDNLFIGHDTPDRMPPYCKDCGNYGHPQIKTCPFATNKKIQPRNGTSRAVHFADNIKSFVESNRGALTGITNKNQWEASALLGHAKDLFTRLNSSKLAHRGGPTPAFIGTAIRKDGRAKRAPIPTMTPSISFETLASIPATLYASALDVGIFTSIDYYTTAIQHWTASRVACSDMSDLLLWLHELKAFCPQTADFDAFVAANQDKILGSLHAFVQRRKRYVVANHLIGDDQELADAMRAEGPLTGWTLPEDYQPPVTSAQLLQQQPTVVASAPSPAPAKRSNKNTKAPTRVKKTMATAAAAPKPVPNLNDMEVENLDFEGLSELDLSSAGDA